MKKIILILIIFGIVTCKKETSTNNNVLTLNNKTYSGCFNKNKLLKSTTSFLSDSLFYTIENGILYLQVNLIYNCCGLIKDSTSIEEGEFNVFISDTSKTICPDNCLCNYGFKYSISNFFQKNIHFAVYLKNQGESKFKLWKETDYIEGLD